jgi:trehalose-6-phosphate synthase
MNLVAKEFVAARNDEQGVLILSQFTGASRELPDALIVNPYDTEEVATALLVALSMSPEEKNARMRRMRQRVREFNIYRWAASLIAALCEIRIDKRDAAHFPQNGAQREHEQPFRRRWYEQPKRMEAAEPLDRIEPVDPRSRDLPAAGPLPGSPDRPRIWR